jgi:hypothetical protein
LSEALRLAPFAAPPESTADLREQLEATERALLQGDARAAADAIARAVACCDALRAQGVRLATAQVSDLTRLFHQGLKAAGALRRRALAAQQALSVSRRAVAAYEVRRGGLRRAH